MSGGGPHDRASASPRGESGESHESGESSAATAPASTAPTPTPPPTLAPASPALPALPASVHLGYGLGSLCTGTFATVPGLLLLYYLTNVMAVPAAAAGIALFLPK
ncbi:MAG: hypothetical protein ACRDP3_18305, partial [Streptomyces sp.]